MAQGERGNPEVAFGDELAEAVRRQVDQVTEALRAEIARLQQEVAERAAIAARGAGYVGAAGALAFVAAGALASLPLIALRKALPPTAVALLVAGGAAAGAGLLARRGLGKLMEAAPESVEQRLAEAEEEVARTLEDRARQAGRD